MTVTMGRRAIVGAALAAAGTAVFGPAMGPARAHGPTRKKVSESIEINAPQEKVWAAIRNFQDMSWLPPVARTEGENGNAVGATRKLTLADGATVEEELSKYEPDMMSYSYRITKVDVKTLPVTNYSSTLSVSPSASVSLANTSMVTPPLPTTMLTVSLAATGLLFVGWSSPPSVSVSTWTRTAA